MPEKVNAIAILQRVPVFEGLSEEKLGKVSKLLKPVKAKSCTTIIKENTKGENLFILLDGEVRVSRFIKGKEEAITFLKPGCLFGEMAILGDLERSATIIAHTDVVMFTLKGSEFINLLNKDKELGFNVYKKMAEILAQRLKALDKRYHDILALI